MFDNMDLRGQLLINLKVLYGPNIEVLTLFVNTDHGYRRQALAIGLDPLMTTGTKFLHSELMGSSTNAIVNLLKKSERKLAELFLAGGTAVPFKGKNNVVQSLTLRKEQDRPGSAGSGSLREDFELVNTPGSSLVDENGPREVVEDDLAGGTAPVEEIAEVFDECMSEKIEGVEDLPTIDEIPAPEPVPEEASVTQYSEYAPVAGRTKKDKKKGRKAKKVSDDPQLVPEEAPIDNFGSWGSSSQMTESKVVSNEPAIIEDPIIPAPEPEPVVEESWGWGSLVSKKGKKKKSKAALEDDCPVVEEPIIPVSELEPLPVTDEPFDFGLPIPKKDKKKKGKRTVDLEEPVITEQLLAMDEPKPESPLDDSGWGPLLLMKKKKKNIREEVIEEPVVEEEAVVPIPEPQPEPEDGGWGSLLKKPKKKKKNTRKEVVEEPVIEEEAVIPIPEPEPEPEDGGWGSLLKKPKKKKGRVIVEDDNPAEYATEEPTPGCYAVEECPAECVAEECPVEKCPVDYVADETVIPDPEPEVDPWSLERSKKDREKDPIAVWDELLVEQPLEEPEPEPETTVEEPAKELSLEPVEVVEYESLVNLTQRKEEEEKNLISLEDVEQHLKSHVLAEPVVENDDWTLWGMKQKREVSSRMEDPKADDEQVKFKPEPNPVSDGGFGSLGIKRKGRKCTLIDGSTLNDNLPPPSKPAPVIEGDIHDHISEAPFASEPKDQTTSTAPSPEPIPTPITNYTSRGKLVKKGGPVVFKIRYANDPDHEPEQVMTRLIENSYEGITETVNLHLDSKSSLKSSHAPRKVNIKSGFGRNGEVDLSELEESMWPQYLEYFCQFTRNIAELTVEIVD